MFSKKQYFEVNREERHYCFLLGHAILSSAEFGRQFNNLLGSKIDRDLGNKPPAIYFEAAALRDYWKDIGDQASYSHETHTKRLEIIEKLLSRYSSRDVSIEDLDFLWTTPEKEKLWFPGKWNREELVQADLGDLRKVTWAFNAIPDLMLDFDSQSILIEAKVESSIGRDSEGYDQIDAQETVSELIEMLVPAYSGKNFSNLILASFQDAHIQWSEIISIASSSDLDDFTMRSFEQLQKIIAA